MTLDRLKRLGNYRTSVAVKKLYGNLFAEAMDTINSKCVGGCNTYKLKAINNSFKEKFDEKMAIRKCDAAPIRLYGLEIKAMQSNYMSLSASNVCIESDSSCAYHYASEWLKYEINKERTPKLSPIKKKAALACLETLEKVAASEKFLTEVEFDWYFDEKNDSDRVILENAEIGKWINVKGIRGYIPDYSLEIMPLNKDSYGVATVTSRSKIPVYSNAELFENDMSRWSMGNSSVKNCIETIKK